jgi:Bacitracin resistance protein BacA.
MDKIIQIIKYILIGFVQGVSEILPISSSGHLVLTYNLLKIDNSIQLDLTIFFTF